jgi:undecaprenyl phosphate-alpha-L-ara4N flippase subunit ArnF
MVSVSFGYALALFTAVIVLVADYVIKHAADGGIPLKSTHMASACTLYAVSAILWYLSMRHISLVQAGVAFSMFSLLALCAVGVIFFGEEIRPREGLGIVLALASMGLMVRLA